MPQNICHSSRHAGTSLRSYNLARNRPLGQQQSHWCHLPFKFYWHSAITILLPLPLPAASAAAASAAAASAAAAHAAAASAAAASAAAASAEAAAATT